MRHKSLIAYLVIVTLLSAGYVVAMKFAGEMGGYLAQVFMLIPAASALIARAFFDERRFADAYLRLGRASHYLRFWLLSLGIAFLFFLSYAALGAGHWDLSGSAFLSRLEEQFSGAGESMTDTLPPGMTPQSMLLLFFVGGLTVFNILPGLITGLGEEFGWRGLMFPRLYAIRPWVAFILGGLIWFAWHLLLTLVVPQAGPPMTIPEKLAIYAALAAGAVCTFMYLAYVYVKSQSIFVTALAHIVMNNASASFSYLFVVEDPKLANLATALVMLGVIIGLYVSGQLKIFRGYSP